MKHFLLVNVLIGLLSFHSFAQDTSALKRPAYQLVVAVDNKFTYTEDLKATPYVLPNMAVQLYPGEKVYLEVEQANGVVQRLTAVKEMKDASRTLIVSFTQTANKGVHEIMMLKIENPFPEKLIYKAKIFLMRQKKWVDTDVYPVEPELTAYESWPDVITSIALGEWKFEK
jgi:hypothetical protein